MAAEFPGWLPAIDAAQKYGIAYNALRQMVKDGVFTRGVFSAAKNRPPIYVRVSEMAAWKRGGVEAVAAVKAAFAAKQKVTAKGA